MRLAVILLGGCSFSPGFNQTDAGTSLDGMVADGPQADAQLCFDGFTPICLEVAPSEPLVIAADDTIETDGARCATTTMGTAAGVCVVAASRIEIVLGATLRATGPRPLVLLATSQLEIAGIVDAASHIGGTLGPGFDQSICGVGVAPTDQTSGGGGYGGTFGSVGGNGGRSVNRGAAGVAVTTLGESTALRGGCAGVDGARTGAGVGGAGGGAIELNAPMIRVSGKLDASGAGGQGGITNDAGGGGGGSGGMIVFSTPQLALVAGAAVMAQGGGGGGGAGGSGTAGSGMDPSGFNVPAPAGDGFHGAGGTFGAGGVGATAGAGATAQDGELIGGGGGGGGTGVIKSSSVIPSGTTVPPVI